MSKKKLGMQQRYMLSEIVHANDWVFVGSQIQGSNYGGQKKHETMVSALESRGLVEVRGEPGNMEVRALEGARDHI